MKNIGESLAGRLAIVDLSPFILPELKTGQMDILWLFGGYPEGGILDATKRVLVCRTASPMDSERLLITNLSGWLEKVMQ